jgi:ABC-2 type transport system ATP-binding protein
MTDNVTDSVIDIAGLRCSYGEFEAVRGISLQVRRGELFALLGTNGAGKTTTIEVLEGLRPATAGQVRVLGLDPVRDRAAVRPRTGVMLQKGGFSDSLTVRETVEMWRSLTAGPRPMAEALELVGLTHKLDVVVAQLSGGEGRRLELALAVLGRPELLFLDEPTTGMDPASRRQTWEVVRELRQRGTTVLLTTHYLEEAETLADRVAIMRAGEIATVGTPETVVRALPSRITFRLPAGAPPVPTLGNAVVEVDADRVTYETRDLQSDLTDLLAWANGNAISLTDLAARPASLEDVFMGIATDGAPDSAVSTDERAEAVR